MPKTRARMLLKRHRLGCVKSHKWLRHRPGGKRERGEGRVTTHSSTSLGLPSSPRPFASANRTLAYKAGVAETETEMHRAPKTNGCDELADRKDCRFSNLKQHKLKPPPFNPLPPGVGLGPACRPSQFFLENGHFQSKRHQGVGYITIPLPNPTSQGTPGGRKFPSSVQTQHREGANFLENNPPPRQPMTNIPIINPVQRPCPPPSK